MNRKNFFLAPFRYLFNIFLSGQTKNEQNMVFNQVISYLLSLLERSNFDLIYLAWLWSIFKPLCYLLLSLYLVPVIILLFMYGSSFFCLIYKHWNRLKVGKFYISI